MKNSRFAALLALVLLLFAIGFWLGNKGRQNAAGKSPAQPKPSATAGAQPTRPTTTVLDHSPTALLARLFEKLRNGSLAPGELDAFRRALLDADPAQAIVAMVKFLATGQDALTGEGFLVGKNGELSGSPTFRALMLDLLGRLCKQTGTDEAATVSRALLEKKTSADEWALALRNIAWATPGDRVFLAAKTHELIRHQPWRQQPSGGYREAFDVAVFLRDPSFISDFSEIVQGEDKSLQRAAAMALDRLAEMAPLDVMNFLNANPAELAAKPFLRADYFSKADLAQPAQLTAMETYLARPDVAPKEKAKLLAVLASPGTFASDNLLTPPPAAEDVPQRITSLHKAATDWLKANRFPDLTEPLLRLLANTAE